MEYLIPQFYDYLNEVGDVDVVGYLFRRQSIPKKRKESTFKKREVL